MKFNLDTKEIFNNLLFKLSKTQISKNNLYKLFVQRDLLVTALFQYKLITEEQLNKELCDYIFTELQQHWLDIKDSL